QPAASAAQNGTPRRSRAGIKRNIGSEGSTYQKVAPAWLAIRSGSWVSRHSHIIPITETSGREAISAPPAGDRGLEDQVEHGRSFTPTRAAVTSRLGAVAGRDKGHQSRGGCMRGRVRDELARNFHGDGAPRGAELRNVGLGRRPELHVR